MTNYLCKFLPNYSDLTQPLQQLLQEKIFLSFEQPQKDAINKLKEIITHQPVLQFYNPNLLTNVTTDSSKYGLGTILEQGHNGKWLQATYASCATTTVEQNYCTFERENLSFLFGCKKFHKFLYVFTSEMKMTTSH